MGAMKEYLLDHIFDFTDEELLKMGYDQEYIDYMKGRTDD